MNAYANQIIAERRKMLKMSKNLSLSKGYKFSIAMSYSTHNTKFHISNNEDARIHSD